MDGREISVWPRGLKKTRQRLEIFKALSETQGPATAQEIFAQLKRCGTPMWLSTIYRVLDTFVEHGMARKDDITKDRTALYELEGGHTHYAVCMDCHRTVAVEGCPFKAMTPCLEDKDFHVLGHRLQFSGYCGDCYRKRQL